VKRPVGNVLKGISGRYKFQTLGEYRALLSLYNLTVEECRGEVRGREYRGFVYSVTDDRSEKIGTPLKASRFGKRYGYEAFERWCAASKEQIKERKLGDMTKATAMAASRRTKDRAEFIALLKAKGVDVVLRETDTGRIYGATFIDHRTGCVLNGSRLGKELSANALQTHFEPPHPGIPVSISLPLSDTPDTGQQVQTPFDDDTIAGGWGLFTAEGGATDAEEQAFMREMQRRKKKRRNKRKI
jgi:hypothetical protein